MDFPKHYSLFKEHDKSFEIHDKRDNKKFHVYKKGIHPANQMKILRLQKFAEGGDVEPSDVEGYDSGIHTDHLDVTPDKARSPGNPQGILDDLNILPNQEPGRDEFGQPIVPANLPTQADSMVAASTPQNPSAMPERSPNLSVSGVPTAQSLSGLESQYSNAVTNEAKGSQAQNTAQANLYEPYLKAEQARAEAFQASMQKYQDQADKVSQDIASSKVDPNHYWSTRTTGQKTASIIGVILGGLAGGISGHPGQNAGLDALHDQINKDIDAQKMDLGKKQSMLSDNLKVQGNLMQAEQATRLQMSAILQGHLAQAAAQTNNPIILARAQQQIAQMKMRDIPLKQSLAQADARRQMLFEANQTGADPERKIAMLSSSPQEFENATKELQAVKNHESQKKAILDAFDRAAEENTVLGRTGRLGYDPPAMKGFKTLMMPYLKDAEGRINEMELQRTDAMLKGVGDRSDTVKEKRSDLVKFLDEKAPSTSHLTKFGINPEQFKQTADGNLVERMTPDGKVVLYDPITKKPVRYK